MFTSVRSSAMAALLIGATILPSSVSAQALDSTTVRATTVVSTPDNTPVAAASGARMTPSGVTNKLEVSPVSLGTQHAMSSGQNLGRNKAMMGVGLAAVVVGLVMGSDVGTLFVVGGALVGLVGLYRYMQ